MEHYEGNVDLVSVNMKRWVERMYFCISTLDLPYTRLLQDSDKADLWSANEVNESGTVIIFSRDMNPLCVFYLDKEFNKNTTKLVSAVSRKVDEILRLERVKAPRIIRLPS